MSQVIITGVDGSDTAARAAMTAGRLASALECELQVVSAYDRSEVERLQIAGDRFEFSTQVAAQTVAADVARALAATYPELSITAVALQGKPAEVLVTLAHNNDAKVIVVGNRRVQGVHIHGSIAEDVAHKAPCDVYIAHTHKR